VQIKKDGLQSARLALEKKGEGGLVILEKLEKEQK